MFRAIKIRCVCNQPYTVPVKHLIARNPKKVAVESAPILVTPLVGENEVLHKKPQVAADNSVSPEQMKETVDLDCGDPRVDRIVNKPKKNVPSPLFRYPES
ncbi:hypothetical protein AVEN_75416-1 [Araneus ventricosus]|uniref:Uncharacterized protein n=1 Tax=Araneus ventricosus TaxID=182803 RepID=A0A4Y2NFD8_ARAVE|nr:hypothetical protein AVEN_75416-1 [Araneus ventricosus]